jgi:hypothetical protein
MRQRQGWMVGMFEFDHVLAEVFVLASREESVWKYRNFVFPSYVPEGNILHLKIVLIQVFYASLLDLLLKS